ncbi:MAG: DUF3306 domain-containing protein [Paracoccaceae bacterium]
MSDFWSRRKAAVAAEEAKDAAEVQVRARSESAAELEAKTDEEILEELGLPDPATLKPGDDFAAFLKDAVPDRIKKVALRKLWTSNPILANVDGLLDYGEDFTDAAVGAGVVETTYQVGKGMLAHVQELARQAEEAARKALEGDEEEVIEASDDAPEIDLSEEGPEPADVADDVHVQPEYPADDLHHEPAPKLRKMTFQFADAAPEPTLTHGN